MTKQTRCGACAHCQHVAAAAADYSSSPTDRRQYRELGEMFPCEADPVERARAAAWRAQLLRSA
jgi:hypothetical protein